MTRRLEPGGRLVLATHNAGKLRELAALLAPHGIAAVSAATLGLPEPDETEDSFLGNAGIKALAAARAGQPALADDSGFSVAALGGDPGVRTADWAMQPDGTRDYARAMAEVARRAGDRDAARRAWFTSALVLAWPDGATQGFEGRIDGRWVWPPRGEHGFGYDPMFVPAGGDRSFGELPPAAKLAIEHRSRAFGRLARACLPGPVATPLGELVEHLAGWAAGVAPLDEAALGGRDTLVGDVTLPLALCFDPGLNQADRIVWQARCAAELAELGQAAGVRFVLDVTVPDGLTLLASGRVRCVWLGASQI